MISTANVCVLYRRVFFLDDRDEHFIGPHVIITLTAKTFIIIIMAIKTTISSADGIQPPTTLLLSSSNPFDSLADL